MRESMYVVQFNGCDKACELEPQVKDVALETSFFE